MKLDNGRSQKLFTDIGALYTLESAAKKSARRVSHEDLSLIRQAAFVTEGSRIIWVGARAKIPKAYLKIKKKISFGGASILPGFVESHTHLVFGGNRAEEFDWRNEGISYQEIAKRGGGILSTLKQTRNMPAAKLLAQAQTSLDDFIRQGVTTLECKSGYGLNFEAEKKLLKVAGDLKKIRVVRTYMGPHALPSEFKTTSDYVDHIINQDLPKIAKQKLAERADIFVEKGFFSQEDGKKYLAAAQKLGLSLTVHADQLSLSGGADLACEFETQSADHLLQIGAKEISKLAQSEVTCNLLPASDLYMNCAYPPARALIDAGARVALATDFNPGTSPTQDLSLIGVLARVQMKMSLAEVICAYTIGGAYALGLQNEMGSIERGKRANFIVLRGDINELFYKIGSSPIYETWAEAKKVFAITSHS